ncbi:MAG: carbonic anhydrase family protein [Candidatus Caenarcaniphilales bacterium]|nr:carbonic anhydrase family protein [Candidatus Caenarcaniphilales bacterium]
MRLNNPLFLAIIYFVLVKASLSYAGVIERVHKTHEWEYGGKHGTKHWGEIKPKFEQCGTGHYQSPINIYETVKVTPRTLEFNYYSFHEVILYNGHTVELLADDKSEVIFEGKHFHLTQFHFHTPSEHVFFGKHYPLEMHLVHESKDEKSKERDYLVIALVFENDDENPFLESFIDDIPKIEETKDLNKFIDLHDLFPKRKLNEEKLYYYKGSLTTPPCNEKVNWLIFKAPLKASKSQIRKIKSVEGVNSRPIQKSYERKVEEFSVNLKE